MKIERISENQIRCTLNKADLADRDLRLSELAYGTDKAKSLFRDMMQQASYELGFEAEDIPLMIEAIPVNQDCLILVITKVEDPEELDTRFSKFSNPISIDMTAEEDYDSDHSSHLEEADDETDTSEKDETSEEQNQKPETIFDLLHELDKGLKGIQATQETPDKTINKEEEPNSKLYRVFTFHSLSEVIEAAKIIHPLYHNKNTLYRNPKNDRYYFVVYQMDSSTEEFSNICSVLCEFATREQGTYASISHIEEHFNLIIPEQALDVLAHL